VEEEDACWDYFREIQNLPVRLVEIPVEMAHLFWNALVVLEATQASEIHGVLLVFLLEAERPVQNLEMCSEVISTGQEPLVENQGEAQVFQNPW